MLLAPECRPERDSCDCAALGTDSCASQARTSSDGMQQFVGAGEGSLHPDCTAGSSAPFGMRTAECVWCRCALQVAEQEWAQAAQVFFYEVLRLAAAPPGECLDWAR